MQGFACTASTQPSCCRPPGFRAIAPETSLVDKFDDLSTFSSPDAFNAADLMLTGELLQNRSSHIPRAEMRKPQRIRALKGSS